MVGDDADAGRLASCAIVRVHDAANTAVTAKGSKIVNDRAGVGYERFMDSPRIHRGRACLAYRPWQGPSRWLR